MRLLTIPDFISKSKERCALNEENHTDLVNKYHYLKSYLENLKVTFDEYRKDKECDKSEHGKRQRKRGENIKFNYRQSNMLKTEINRIGKEVDRLVKLII